MTSTVTRNVGGIQKGERVSLKETDTGVETIETPSKRSRTPLPSKMCSSQPDNNGQPETPKIFPETPRGLLYGLPAANFGGVTYDEEVPRWTPCYRTSQGGQVVMDSWVKGQFAKEPRFRTFIQATGKLFNTTGACGESGFWATDTLFVSALHFGRWWTGIAPSELELISARDEAASGTLHVSSDPYNTAGLTDDDLAVKVDLVKWDRRWDIGIFRAVGRVGVHVGIDQLIEHHELSHESIRLRPGDFALTCGYNGTPEEEIETWKKKYIASCTPERVADLSKVKEPNYHDILLPNFRTVSIGKVHSYDSDANTLQVQCPVWRGFSGGPVTWQNCGSAEDAACRVLGIVQGGQEDGQYNLVKLLPTGLRASLMDLESRDSSGNPNTPDQSMPSTKSPNAPTPEAVTPSGTPGNISPEQQPLPPIALTHALPLAGERALGGATRHDGDEVDL